MLEQRIPFRAMGSPCELWLYAGSASALEHGARAGSGEVARLERKYSRYRDDSVTSEINRAAGTGRGVRVDPETATLLDYAATAHAQSEGLFDITSGCLRRIWDFRGGRVPSQPEVDALLGQIGWGRVRWANREIELPIPGMELDFGGYVKEYAADRAALLCRDAGIEHGLVDLGGDLAVIGPHPDGSPWRVGIRDPRERTRAIASIRLDSGGLATSGDYERFVMKDGRRFGHILSPRTGWPVESFPSVSAVASCCLIAGTATTIALLRGEQNGARWLDELGLPSLRVHRDGSLSGSLGPRAQRVEWPMRKRWPSGSRSVNSRTPQGLSPGGSTIGAPRSR
jgi:thiamine biosynthesis lipoprotein